MVGPHYPQFCALARSAEVLGERWTLLIIRELLLGPKRFTDLRSRLQGISPSVLSERLARLEELGLLRRDVLEPPAASTVYELTDDGLALEPTIWELVRWGARFLLPARPDDKVEPDWVRLALVACARRSRAPRRSFELRIPDGRREMVVHVAGGPRGTSVTLGRRPADLTITADPAAILGLMSGVFRPLDALGQTRIRARGDLTALSIFPQLFEMTLSRGGDHGGPGEDRAQEPGRLP